MNELNETTSTTSVAVRYCFNVDVHKFTHTITTRDVDCCTRPTLQNLTICPCCTNKLYIRIHLLRRRRTDGSVNAKTATTMTRNSEGRRWPSFDDASVDFPYSRPYSTIHFVYNNVVKRAVRVFQRKNVVKRAVRVFQRKARFQDDSRAPCASMGHNANDPRV